MLMAAGAGLVASLSLPPVGFFAGLFSLSLPMLLLARSPSKKDACWLGLATGFGWFVFSLSWVSQAFITSGGGHVLLIPFAALGLPVLLASFWAVAFMVTAALVAAPLARLVLLPAMLMLAEHLRGWVLTGFPWNTPGMVFANADVSLAIAAYAGVWGLGLLALIFAAIPALLLLAGGRPLAVVAMVLLALAGLTGLYHSRITAPNTVATAMTVRLIQPNIDQREKWRKDLRPGHFARLIEMSRQPSPRQLDLVVWPESAFAGVLEREQGTFEAVTMAASSGVVPVLTGALRIEDGPQLFNAMVLAGPDGRLLGSFDKMRLVPFGEYAPLREYLPFVDAIAGPLDFSAGEERPILELDRRDGRKVKMLPLICYEAIFPSLVRSSWGEHQPDVMVTITNDAWFGNTIGPRQHLATARMRSAELGTPMIRAANTGISAVIDSHGRVTHRIEYAREGYVDTLISGQLDTFYARFGDLIFMLLTAFLAFAALAIQRLTGENLRR